MLTLHLPIDRALTLRDELNVAGRREIGGILMGEQLAPSQFRIADMTFQRHGGMIARFVRSARLALVALQRFFAHTGHRYHRFNYLGEWHSHPSFEPRPSDEDHASMIDVACHQNTGANFVVLMIVRLDDAGELEGSATVYLPDGSVRAGVLSLDAPVDHPHSDRDRPSQTDAETRRG